MVSDGMPRDLEKGPHESSPTTLPAPLVGHDGKGTTTDATPRDCESSFAYGQIPNYLNQFVTKSKLLRRVFLSKAVRVTRILPSGVVSESHSWFACPRRYGSDQSEKT